MKLFLKIRETKGEVEIVSQTESKSIRCGCIDDGSGDYMILVELEMPDVSTKQFKYLFQNLCNENVDLTDECTSSE